MTEDQAKARKAMYGLLVCSLVMSLISMTVSWQQRSSRKRELQEMKQQVKAMQQQLEELEARAAKMKLKAAKAGEEPVAEEAASGPGK
jgi:uncharacterized membrane-anchored protein YhcB (DUF1043 family)